MKSHRRRRRLRLRQCTLTVPPTVQIGVVRIDQCSPGCRRRRALTLSRADTPVNQYWGRGILWYLNTVRISFFCCSEEVPQTWGRYWVQNIRWDCRLSTLLFLKSWWNWLNLSQCISRIKKYTFCLWCWFCISTRIYCFESFSLIILFSRLLLQWQ